MPVAGMTRKHRPSSPVIRKHVSGRWCVSGTSWLCNQRGQLQRLQHRHLSPYTSQNAVCDEKGYINSFNPQLSTAGWDAHFIVDTGTYTIKFIECID
ncbi:hypothetical protein BDW66DRAFT_134214 [Aspergillus desertorum]